MRFVYGQWVFFLQSVRFVYRLCVLFTVRVSLNRSVVLNETNKVIVGHYKLLCNASLCVFELTNRSLHFMIKKDLRLQK